MPLDGKHGPIKYNCGSDRESTNFIAFKSKVAESLKFSRKPLMPLRPFSIQALSPKRFLILDSAGDLHILHFLKSSSGSILTCYMRQLPHVMNVQKLAVLPDLSLRTQTVWISDGYHSVHILAISDMDPSASENGSAGSEEQQMEISVIHAIFAGEKIQDVVPTAPNGILILGEGNIYAYGIS